MTTIDPRRRMLLRCVGGLAGITALTPTALLTACKDNAAAGTKREGAGHYGLENGPFDVDIRLRARPDTVPIVPELPVSHPTDRTGTR